MFLDGELLTNIAVGSYLEIRKGFLSIIGRVEGERIEEDFQRQSTSSQREPTDRSRRILTIAFAGYIDEHGTCVFCGVIAAMPMKLNVKRLPLEDQPRGATREFNVIVPSQAQRA